MLARIGFDRETLITVMGFLGVALLFAAIVVRY